MTRIMRPREQQESASMRRRFDDAVIQSYRARATALILPLLPRIPPFLLLLSSPSSSSPSSPSSARASYFEREIRGRNRKRHGRVSNRYSIAVSPRTGPSLSARSTISNSLENFFFLPLPEILQKSFFPDEVGGIFIIRLGKDGVKNYRWTF